MSPSRSKALFLHAATTKELVERVAASRSLVIYAGSGVTIDRTGLDWRRLLSGLLEEAKSKMGDAEYQARLAAVDGLPVLQFASTIRSIYRQWHGADWRHQMALALNKMLYTTYDWRGGRYTDSIARLARNLRLAGRKVVIITTNFETMIDEAFTDSTLTNLFAEVAPVTAELEHDAAGEEDRGDAEGDASTDHPSIAVLHVHGVLPRTLPSDEQPELVIGEVDYYESETAVAETLATYFSESDVLVLGSGLEDPPLLRALAKSVADAKASDLQRWVLLTKPSIVGAPTLDDLDAAFDAKLPAFQDRLQEFGLIGIYPDFYSQTHQFVREIAAEVVNATDDQHYSSTDADYTYGKRLRAWWTAWYGELSSNHGGATKAADRRQEAQLRDHELLRENVAKIRDAISAPSSENLKIEVWARWDPTDSSRELRCWVTSTGPWVDEKTLRTGEISANSGLTAVRSFTSGGVEIVDVQGNDRWKRYVGVPIEQLNSDGERSFIVGVVTVATDSAKSNLDEKKATMAEFVRDATSAGAQILLDLTRSLGDPR